MLKFFHRRYTFSVVITTNVCHLDNQYQYNILSVATIYIRIYHKEFEDKRENFLSINLYII